MEETRVRVGRTDSKMKIQIAFGVDIPCQVLCTVKTSAKDAAWLSHLVNNDYKVEWYLDNLPGATPFRTTANGNKQYVS